MFITITDFTENVQVIKITIENKKLLSNWSVIPIAKKAKIVGAFDMNKDGFIDLLYVDTSDNVSLYIFNYT